MRALLPARCCGAAAPRIAPCAARRRLPSAPRATSGADDASGEQQRTPLVDALRRVAADGAAPFHVPGHQRGQGAPPVLHALFGSGAWAHDLTELDGLDYLSAPRGAIAAAQTLAARAFGAGRTWFLINGTTVGVHAAVLAACRPGDAVVLGRNCHGSALAACALAGVVPFFAEAPLDEALGVAHAVTPAAAAAALDAAAAACSEAPSRRDGTRPRVALLLVVSPTYFGAAADVEGLAREAHARGVPLAVDEAHGPHLSFAKQALEAHCGGNDALRAALLALPCSALAGGADVAVQSTHKTLPALTQAAMLHCAASGRVPSARLAAALQLLQSSSPSYLLLASLDAARAHAATGAPLAAAVARASEARAGIALRAPSLRVLGPSDVGAAGVDALDITRLTVATSGLGAASGYAVAAFLAREGVTPELVAPRCVVFVIASGTTRRDVARLVSALARLAAEAPQLPGGDAQADAWPQLPPAPEAAMSPRRATFADRERVALAHAAGRISADTLCPYPPGIPVAFPGSVLSAETLRYCAAVVAAGGAVTGGADPSCALLDVVARKDEPLPGASLWDAPDG